MPAHEPTADDGRIDEHWFAGSRGVAGRRVRIWQPNDAAGAATPLAVLYAQDGQNAFDDASAFAGRGLRLQLAAQRLLAKRQIRPVLLVAIDNSGPGRVDDYTPVAWHGRGGGAERYAEFLLDKVLPFVAAHYPVASGPSHQALVGASLGGLFALCAGLRLSAVFGQVAAFSPSVFWGDGHLLRIAAARPQLPLRIWLEAGTREGPELRQSVTALAELLLARGYRKHRSAAKASLRHAEVAGGRHDEASWSRRAERALRFLFPVVATRARRRRRAEATP